MHGLQLTRFFDGGDKLDPNWCRHARFAGVVTTYRDGIYVQAELDEWLRRGGFRADRRARWEAKGRRSRRGAARRPMTPPSNPRPRRLDLDDHGQRVSYSELQRRCRRVLKLAARTRPDGEAALYFRRLQAQTEDRLRFLMRHHATHLRVSIERQPRPRRRGARRRPRPRPRSRGPDPDPAEPECVVSARVSGFPP